MKSLLKSLWFRDLHSDVRLWHRLVINEDVFKYKQNKPNILNTTSAQYFVVRELGNMTMIPFISDTITTSIINIK